jgi:hypothetical protein
MQRYEVPLSKLKEVVSDKSGVKGGDKTDNVVSSIERMHSAMLLAALAIAERLEKIADLPSRA